MKNIRKILKITFGVILFFLIIFEATVFCNELLREKRGDVLDFGEYRAEKNNTIDVLFLGSSHVFMNVLPVTIWEEADITSYNITSSMQVSSISYYYLVEALKTQSPKVIAFDIYMINQKYPDEWRARLAMGAMPWSANKIEAIRDAIPDEYKFKCYFELYEYHNNWNRLMEYDYKYALKKLFFADNVSFLKGSEISLEKISQANQSYNYTPMYSMPDEEAYSYNLEYIKKIAQAAAEAGAEMLLFSAPCPNAGMTEYYLERVASDLKEAGFDDIKILDVNKYRNQMNFDYSRDMTDATHCNSTGAKKTSRQIADFLKENYTFPDRRADADLAELWDSQIILLDEYIDNGIYRPWTGGAVSK